MAYMNTFNYLKNTMKLTNLPKPRPKHFQLSLEPRDVAYLIQIAKKVQVKNFAYEERRFAQELVDSLNGKQT